MSANQIEVIPAADYGDISFEFITEDQSVHFAEERSEPNANTCNFTCPNLFQYDGDKFVAYLLIIVDNQEYRLYIANESNIKDGMDSESLLGTYVAKLVTNLGITSDT